MGILEILTLIFVVAKIGGYIDWSWWLVFAPMYPALVLYIVWGAVFFGIWRRVRK